MKGDNDIVYILKADAPTEELRYSLRSVVRNFKFRKVWFYCGCPDGLVPDHHVPFTQRGTTRFERSCSTLRAICGNDEITPTFYLFNDDFFIMRKYDQDTAIVQGSIHDHLARLDLGTYYILMQRQLAWLLGRGQPTMDYATHTPLPVDRAKALELLDIARREHIEDRLFRNLYGNWAHVPYTVMPDCKIADDGTEPDPDAILLSTNDGSFECGRVGEYIRETFTRKCRYES